MIFKPREAEGHRVAFHSVSNQLTYMLLMSLREPLTVITVDSGFIGAWRMEVTPNSYAEKGKGMRKRERGRATKRIPETTSQSHI